MKKKINFTGIIVGIIFLGLAALCYKWSLTDKDNGVTQGILLFGGIGIFFIYQALKGKSTSSIFKTDVGGVVGVSPGTSAWSYLKWVFLAILLIASASFIFVSFLFRPLDVNSWQNKIGCLMNYKCLHIEDFEPNTLKPYTTDSAVYTQRNHGFFLKFPETWKIDYKKNSEICNQKDHTCWEFKISNKDSRTTFASNLSGSATMYLEVYSTHPNIDEYVSNVLSENKDNVVLTEEKSRNWYTYHLSSKTNKFLAHYLVWGNKYTHRIWFDSTVQADQDKIVKYLSQLSYFE